MKPEARFSNRLSAPLRATGRIRLWKRIEDTCNTGTPDVHFAGESDDGRVVAGWVELKHITGYPKRISTALRFKRFTPKQALVLEELHAIGLQSFVLCQVSADVWLFSGDAAEELRAGVPVDVWRGLAVGHWRGKINYDELSRLLCNFRNTKKPRCELSSAGSRPIVPGAKIASSRSLS